MAKQYTRLKLIAIIDGDEYEMSMDVDPKIRDKVSNTFSLIQWAEALGSQLGTSLEVSGIFPRSDASKYTMDENGNRIERPESDFEKYRIV